jgi:hypothetical protein
VAGSESGSVSVTPNFSWPLIEPTDFVTNLPADLETLADAIDADVYTIETTANNAETLANDLNTKVPINTQTGTSYTLVLADAGKLITSNNGSPVTITVPPNDDVAFEIGTRIDILSIGAGLTTLAQGSGVTINSKDNNKKLSAQGSAGSLIKTATNTWWLVGDLDA